VDNLNQAAVNMPRSGIRVILDEANKLENVIHLEIGQPDFPTPPHIIEAAMRAAYDGYTGYTPNAGYSQLRDAFANRLNIDSHLNVSSNQITVTAGAMGALFNAFCAFISPGDEVLIPDPGYPNYYMPIGMLGGKAIPYPLLLDDEFPIRADMISPLITRFTKVIVINSPSNPSGSVINESELIKILELANKNGLKIISDEAYDHILFEGQHISPLKYSDSSSIVAIYSCSKTYSMTGWRVGFLVTSPNLAPLMSKLQEMYISCAPSISQKAAEAALNGPQTCVRDMVNVYQKRKDISLELCNTLNVKYVKPKGAFYLMIKLPECEKANSMQFALGLLKSQKVAVAPGITFGGHGEGFVRVSLCANQDVICSGLRIIASSLQTNNT
jgi:aspartate aminotransferase/aminotransferase